MSDYECFGCRLLAEIQEVTRKHKDTHEIDPELGKIYFENVLGSLAQAEYDITQLTWNHYGRLVN
jgi:CRISPR/Cas system-associated endonuclease Cas1